MSQDFAYNILSNFGGLEANSFLKVLGIDNEENNEINITNPSPYYSLEQFVDYIHTLKDKFVVLSLNIQSINAKFDNFTILIDVINKQNSLIDAICLQETWLDEHDDLSIFQIPNYYCISQPKHCSTHAGLVIYLNKKYNYEIIDISHKSDIWEDLFIHVSISKCNKSIILGDIYKPPKDNNNNANIEAFINELTPKIQYLLKSKADVILCGDFNINLLQINNRPAFSDYMDTLITNNFCPTITYPTRFTDASCTLIDNILYKGHQKNNLLSSGIIFTDKSDHLPCFTALQL